MEAPKAARLWLAVVIAACSGDPPTEPSFSGRFVLVAISRQPVASAVFRYTRDGVAYESTVARRHARNPGSFDHSSRGLVSNDHGTATNGLGTASGRDAVLRVVHPRRQSRRSAASIPAMQRSRRIPDRGGFILHRPRRCHDEGTQPDEVRHVRRGMAVRTAVINSWAPARGDCVLACDVRHEPRIGGITTARR